MKTLTLFILLVGGTWGFTINIPTATNNLLPTVHYDWVHMQKLVLPLFEDLCEDSKNPMLLGLADEFSMDMKNVNFSITSGGKKLKELIDTKALLPKHEIFSEYNQQHYEEFRFFSELLYNINDFHTFLQVAAWTHQNLNCGLYLNVIYSALLRRRDTRMLSVPAPYEIIPNYFITKDAIITGSTLLTGGVPTPDNTRVVGNTYVVDVNYTADFYDNDDESTLAYFHEDIGLNTYVYLSKLQKSLWLNNPLDMDSRYGEYAYHMMKQLNTRYNLERYSNGFDDVLSINWREPVTAMYDPKLIYSNGIDFGRRTKYLDPTTIVDTAVLQEIENNVYDIALHMKQNNYNRTQIMNTIIELLITGDKSYDKIAYLNAGKNNDMNYLPSVLEHYMTLMRDPIFWKINRKMVEIIDNTLEQLQPKYDKNELFFPGVEIVNVDIKKMSTFCDDFDFDVTDALKPADSETNFIVKMSQPRLNHKAFSMKFNISSLVSQKGLMKVFLGPKMLPGEFASKKHQFMLLDSFEIVLKKGGNAISRSSDEMNYLAEDFLSLKTLRKKVQDAEFGLDVMLGSKIDRFAGFPSRLLLPKGSDDGMQFQLFAFIAPFVKVTMGSVMMTSTEYNSATLNPRYPLDTHMDDWELFDLPNAFTKEVIITHKAYSKPNAAGGNTYAGKKWEQPGSYDYTDKKGQYGGKEDYSLQKHFEQSALDINKDTQPFETKSKWDKYITDDKKIDDKDSVTPSNDDNISQNFVIDYDIPNTKKYDTEPKLLEKSKYITISDTDDNIVYNDKSVDKTKHITITDVTDDDKLYNNKPLEKSKYITITDTDENILSDQPLEKTKYITITDTDDDIVYNDKSVDKSKHITITDTIDKNIYNDKPIEKTKYITITDTDDENIDNKNIQPLKTPSKWFKWPKYMRSTRNADDNDITYSRRPYLKPRDESAGRKWERSTFDYKDRMLDDDLNTYEILDDSRFLQAKPKWSKYVHIADSKLDKDDIDVNIAPMLSYPKDDSIDKTEYFIMDEIKPKIKANIFLTLQFPVLRLRKPTVYDYLLPNRYTQTDDEDSKVYM